MGGEGLTDLEPVLGLFESALGVLPVLPLDTFLC